MSHHFSFKHEKSVETPTSIKTIKTLTPASRRTTKMHINNNVNNDANLVDRTFLWSQSWSCCDAYKSSLFCSCLRNSKELFLFLLQSLKTVLWEKLDGDTNWPRHSKITFFLNYSLKLKFCRNYTAVETIKVPIVCCAINPASGLLLHLGFFCI